MIQKIYGVDKLHDWSVVLNAGKASLRVYFEGGTTTARGVIPATYTTFDPVKQAIIERSEYFKHGRIRIVQQMEIPDDAAAIARKEWKERIAKRHDAEMAGSVMPDGGVAAKRRQDDVTQLVNTSAPIKVATKSDAIEWLKEHYPEKEYTAVKLRSKAAFDAACEECGVVFEIAE